MVRREKRERESGTQNAAQACRQRERQRTKVKRKIIASQICPSLTLTNDRLVGINQQTGVKLYWLEAHAILYSMSIAL